MLGDKNIKFFHIYTIQRRNNKISMFADENNIWIYNEDELQKMVTHFYSDLYKLLMTYMTSFVTSACFPSTLDIHKTMMEIVVTLKETRCDLFSMRNYKSPGSNGYHPIFFKIQWNTLGLSIHKMIIECFEHLHKIKKLNQILPTLIPIYDDPSRVSHLRNIDLCNVNYKIMSKIISHKLRKIMPYVVSKTKVDLYLANLRWTIS